MGVDFAMAQVKKMIEQLVVKLNEQGKEEATKDVMASRGGRGGPRAWIHHGVVVLKGFLNLGAKGNSYVSLLGQDEQDNF